MFNAFCRLLQILSPFSLSDEREMDVYFLPKLDLDLRFPGCPFCSEMTVTFISPGDCKKQRAAQDHYHKLPVPIWKAASLPFVCIHLSEMNEVFPAAVERLVCF